MASRYRALVGLSYPTDPDVVRRLQAGERVSPEELRLRHVDRGEVVDDIPEVSVSWLLQTGAIEPVTEAEHGKARKR